jgi:hypothetical protein
MGSMGHWQEQGRKKLLASLFSGEYECAVRLVGTDKETGEPRTGEYKLFKDFYDTEIIEYAKEVSENGIVEVSKIECLILKPIMRKEILL